MLFYICKTPPHSGPGLVLKKYTKLFVRRKFTGLKIFTDIVLIY